MNKLKDFFETIVYISAMLLPFVCGIGCLIILIWLIKLALDFMF